MGAAPTSDAGPRSQVHTGAARSCTLPQAQRLPYVSVCTTHSRVKRQRCALGVAHGGNSTAMPFWGMGLAWEAVAVLCAAHGNWRSTPCSWTGLASVCAEGVRASPCVMPCELYFCTPELNCSTNAHTSHMAGTESILPAPASCTMVGSEIPVFFLHNNWP